MAVFTHDPFALLGLSRNADAMTIEAVYQQTLETASAEEREILERECSLLIDPHGLLLARLATPVGGKSFDQLKASLPARPRYLGPGKWKKVLRRMLQE